MVEARGREELRADVPNDATAARRTRPAAVTELALSARARVRVAQGESGQAAIDVYEALTIANATGAHLATADTLECPSRVAYGADSHTEAARLLGAAHAHRQRLGLVRFEVFDDDHHALVSSSETRWAARRGERKRPSSGWRSLTPTELDIVRLVAEGIPNKDIATRLFVSPRTVQSHLRHVYNKLALTSPVQLAQEAARRSASPQ